MRIARVLTRLNLGGPARQALASDPCSRRAGTSCACSRAGAAGRGRSLRRAARARPRRRARPGPRAALAVARRPRALQARGARLATFAPDVVHTHASKAGRWAARAAARACARTARVHTFHGHVLEGYFPAALSSAASRSSASLARRHGPHRGRLARDGRRPRAPGRVEDEEKLVVCQPGVDLEPLLVDPRARRRPGRRRAAPRAGRAPTSSWACSGRLAEVKRPELGASRCSRCWPRATRACTSCSSATARSARTLERGSARCRRSYGAGARTWSARGRTCRPCSRTSTAAAHLALGGPAGGADRGRRGRAAGGRGGRRRRVRDRRARAHGLARRERGRARLRPRAAAREPAAARAMGRRARLRVAAAHSAETLAARLEELYTIVCDERARAGDRSRARRPSSRS